MKKILFALIMLACTLHGFSQMKDTLTVQQKEEMLFTAKKNRTTGTVLLSVGGAAFITGLIVWANGFANPVYHEGTDEFSFPNEGLGTALFVGGGALCLISIPFWKTSNKLRRQVKNAHIGLAPSFVPSTVSAGTIGRVPQATFSLQIPVGR